MSSRVDLPSRYPELGRLRLGEKGPKGEPKRLTHWRATSRDEYTIKAFASKYGGDCRAWQGHQGEWEVLSETSVLEVQLPLDALDLSYEMWGSGGLKRRCDGARVTVPVQDPEGGHYDTIECECKAMGLDPLRDRDACNLTLRLRVVLPELPGVGVWMLTSGSKFAAQELPGQVDLIDAIRTRTQILIPCTLSLEQRTMKVPFEKFERRFAVPTLRVSSSMAALQAGAGEMRALKRPSPAPLAPARSA